MGNHAGSSSTPNGHLYHLVDGSWNVLLGNDLYAVIYNIWHFSSSSIWFIGGDTIWNFSYIYFWNGNELQELTSPTEYSLKGICMFSETDGWAVGNNGVVLRYH